MSLRRLKWLTILSPLVFFVVIGLGREILFPSLFGSWPGYLLLAGIVLIAALFFSEAVFNVIDGTQAELEQTNRELLALHVAGLDIISDLELGTVLQRVVDEARTLVGARYGAMSFLREDGNGIEAFLTSGITPEERAAIGPIPEGHGLLAVVLQQGERLRLEDLTKDPKAIGFPPHHPPMHSLLAVPIVASGSILGNLYLTEKEDVPTFDESDEETLQRFATLAALAIENARLHRQVGALAMAEERERIAREIHDSVAQVLGYVNTKAQAAEELIRADQPEKAATQIGQLGAAARDAYADVREHILGLRTVSTGERDFLATLHEYLTRWREQSGVVATLVTEPDEFAPRLSDAAELQMLRIIQEGLSNVRKHAGATVVTVHLIADDGWIEARIEDNGSGFDPTATRSADYPRFGLSTMRERAESVGGTLEIESAAGRGTRIVARMPKEPSIITGRITA
ncbi:MAG TPA: GAF domain-containing sensor histidine kinase [Thermomicrobiales bacterium]|nr:GAF domain-containing sensor histidine kinase [Thermomicrobiales bacterium]